MSSNLQNSIWPNEGGTLGQIKVQIPTGTANDPWPTGDALVNNFVFNKGKLVGFVDTKALIANDSKTTIFPYDYVNIRVDKSLEDVMTFNGCAKPEYLNVTYVEDIIKNNDGTGNSGDTVIATIKYKGCTTVNDVRAVDPAYQNRDIIDGVWSEGLGDLEDANGMFQYCSNLKTFKSDLSSLTMGSGMFVYCSNLTSFSAKLSKLTNGVSMFLGCKLDTTSIQFIADNINTVSSGVLHIGIGNSTINEEEKAAFNKMVSKGWTVFVCKSNGSQSQWTPTSLTPIDGEEQQTPIPFWAKPVPSDEEHAQYVDAQGNFYNILGGNYIYGDNLENYGMFISEEDAAAQMRLTKIEK